MVDSMVSDHAHQGPVLSQLMAGADHGDAVHEILNLRQQLIQTLAVVG